MDDAPESPLTIRPATADDLPAIWDVKYEADAASEPTPPSKRPVSPYLPHLLATGRVLVAEQNGRVAGFAALARRGRVAFLSDLFVHPAVQSGAIGRRLLRAVLPSDAIRATTSSTDFRAVALYTRAGMQPRWPHLILEAHADHLRRLPTEGIEIVEADPDDPELGAWDADLSGRDRPEDRAFWVREEAGVPLWFRRHDETVGYGFVRLATPSYGYGRSIAVGPLGVREPATAVPGVLAALAWARERGPIVELSVPGPHPALAPLLEAGARIGYIETFCASGDEDFVDARRYLASGGALC